MRKAKNHVDEGLEKVRAQRWAQPLGRALEVSGKIVELVGDFVPGGNIIGGALSFGATLLNPPPDEFDLQSGLAEVKAAIEGARNQEAVRALEAAQKSMEERLARPVEEMRVEFKEIHLDMKKVFKEVGDSHRKISEEMIKMKDMISKNIPHCCRQQIQGKCPSIERLNFTLSFRRTVLRQLTQHTLSSFESVFRIFSCMPSSFKPVLPRT